MRAVRPRAFSIPVRTPRTPGAPRTLRTLRTLRAAAALVLAALAGMLAGCGSEPWPGDAERDRAATLGAAASDQLMSTLVRHLTAAVDSAGPERAIEFCSSQAIPLTHQAADVVGGVELKRTSVRVRNPANAPDALEEAALAYFESQKEATGSLPTSWIQEEGDQAIRYYRPLVVNELCVRCHGPVTALAPEVVEALDRLYPDDQATGYLPGDFRGLLRVRIPRATLEAEGQ